MYSQNVPHKATTSLARKNVKTLFLQSSSVNTKLHRTTRHYLAVSEAIALTREVVNMEGGRRDALDCRNLSSTPDRNNNDNIHLIFAAD